ncbi:pantetheine-phosphate adenylyltransferase [Corynebacterium pyruviciproducens]|uniref:Phosphopantetheine adenylyltransferase n=1 Tax=Corynebacterium pyruviciproducens TaxID=598660 RepID=A0AAF1BQQ4_9CORY|nr:pantetheine-phosphate adenylyltransferase [Corynebacterium pyruviciproducens]MDH4658492.1 pantetheine-phosphate adenylyltransferase [Corynebacterium pyruviciproducens]MDK6565153.1 pantetheine-phosphate adenylyltransferase [Corynebacterium pyruviciproducens]WOT01053.1 pantetheine-phosphate adenylyltransferase [Corynebacterium pyruviciproducens]
MTTVCCPGSFDPITYGHLDIIQRASKQFEHVVVLVTVNKSKKAMFTPEERMDLIRECVHDLPNVTVDHWEGLLVDYTSKHGITAMVKGLRSGLDYEYEKPMAQANSKLTGVETFFLLTSPAYGYISSSIAKEVSLLGGDANGMLPDNVLAALERKRDALK